MKRILSVLAICALLLSALAAIAMAEGTVPSLEIAVNDTSVNVGETVTADVYLKNYASESWVTVTATVNYNTEKLEYVEVVNGEVPAAADIIPEVHNDAANGKVHICWIDLNGIPNDPAKAMASVKFKAVAEASSVVVGTEFAEDGQVSAEDTDKPIVNDPENPTFSEEETVIETPVVIRPEGTVDPSTVTIESVVDPDNKATFEVKATFTESGDVDKYKVNVSWASEGFIYTEAGTEWNPRDHKWEVLSGAEWTGTGSISLENHSSKEVTATFGYAPEGNDTAMNFKNGENIVGEEGVRIEAPAVTEEGAEVTAPGKATITTEIASGTVANEEFEKIGTITVTIA